MYTYICVCVVCVRVLCVCVCVSVTSACYYRLVAADRAISAARSGDAWTVVAAALAAKRAALVTQATTALARGTANYTACVQQVWIEHILRNKMFN